MPRRLPMLALALLLIAAGCSQAGEAPTATPDRQAIQAAATLFAQPTRSTQPTPTVTPLNMAELDISRSLAQMERAVLAGDADGYLAYVSQQNPVFWAEHTGWVQDWVEHPLRAFEIDVYGIQSLSDDLASGRMTIRWAQRGSTASGSSGGATVSALFRYEDGAWKFGGEDWQTFDTEGVRFYFFANDVIDNSPQAQRVIEYLPSVVTGVTHEFDYTPERIAHLKLYESRVTLQNFTRLSQPEMLEWNEPGNSIKMSLTPNNTAPDESAVGREYARFVLYEMAGGTHGAFPWWLEDGVAEYGGQRFRPLSQRNQALKRVAALTLEPDTADQHLLAWNDLEAQPDLAPAMRTTAVQQAYSLVYYVTEAHGVGARNAWIKAIAGGQPLGAATQAALGVTWDALDAAWRAWLPTLL